jgi:hypothetical protein
LFHHAIKIRKSKFFASNVADISNGQIRNQQFKLLIDSEVNQPKCIILEQ